MNNRKKMMLALAGTLLAGFVIGGAVLADRLLQPASAEKYGVGSASTVEQMGSESVDYSVYEPYGLVYDKENQAYIYNGNAVRFFHDKAAGASFTNFYSGTVDIEAERDQNNALTGIKECSREVYEKHTEKYSHVNGKAGTADDDTAQEEGTSSERLLKDYEGVSIIYNEQDNGWYYNRQRIEFLWDSEKPLIYVDEKVAGICISVTRSNGKISGIKEISEADVQAILEKKK